MNEFEQDIYEEQTPEGFVIDSLEKAEWAFKKINANNKRLEEIKAIEIAEKEKIEDWALKKSMIATASNEYLKNLLAEYLNSELAKDKNFKLSTPSGTAYFRKNKPKLIYDENEAIEKLEPLKIEGLIKNVKIINKSELNKAITVVGEQAISPDGEVLDFIAVEEQGATLVVKMR